MERPPQQPVPAVQLPPVPVPGGKAPAAPVPAVPVPAGQAPGAQAFGDILARTDGEPVLLTQPVSSWVGRAGGWGMWSSGSPAKVGEYQSVQSSPFVDLDGLWSNGYRTVSATATLSDNDTASVNLYGYTPWLTAKVNLQSYLHELDHESLTPLNIINGPDAVPTTSSANPKVVGEDLNLGENYAVRVTELKSSFKLIASSDLKVRVDVWGMNKDGTRQVNAVAMCYSSAGAPATLPDGHPLVPFNGALGGVKCHVLSQSQQINWTTIEVKPVIEWKVNDSLTLEYSRPMRGFTADDQTVGRYTTLRDSHSREVRP